MPPLAALPAALEAALAVLGGFSSWVSVRAAVAGFAALMRGRSAGRIAEATALGAAAAVPTAALAAVAIALYLLVERG